MEAEAAGVAFSEKPKRTTTTSASANVGKNKRTGLDEQEEKDRLEMAKSLMPKKKRKLYERMKASNERKQEEVRSLYNHWPQNEIVGF